jgi:hypothetical protein
LRLWILVGVVGVGCRLGQSGHIVRG